MHLVEQDTAFNNDLFELKKLTKDGKGEQDLKESAWNKVQKFLYVLHCGSKRTITFNGKAIAEENNPMGILPWFPTAKKIRSSVHQTFGLEMCAAGRTKKDGCSRGSNGFSRFFAAFPLAESRLNWYHRNGRRFS